MRKQFIYENSDTDPAKLSILMIDGVSVCRNSWRHSTPEGWAITDEKTAGALIEVSKKVAAKGGAGFEVNLLYMAVSTISYG